MIHRIWKTFVFASLLASYVFFASLARFLVWDKTEQRALLLGFLHRKCRVLLAVMGVRVTIEGRENLRPGQNYFIVANHMSYLDPLVVAAFTPTSFVTSVEMRDAFFLGTFTKLAGCYYVERRTKGNIRQEVGDIEDGLKKNFKVTVFPEATSTDGSHIKPFKRPLFAAAIRTQTPVLPMAIQYESVDGVRLDRANHRLLCWYADMSFFPHSLRLLGLRDIHIRLSVLPEIPVAADSDRDTIAETAFEAIRSHYQPIL